MRSSSLIVCGPGSSGGAQEQRRRRRAPGEGFTTMTGAPALPLRWTRKAWSDVTASGLRKAQGSFQEGGLPEIVALGLSPGWHLGANSAGCEREAILVEGKGRTWKGGKLVAPGPASYSECGRPVETRSEPQGGKSRGLLSANPFLIKVITQKS